MTQETCTGIETYNEDLTDNGFLQRLGQGLEIVLVASGRGYLGDENKGKPAVPYWGGEYGEEGDDIFHKQEDTVRLGCKLGYQNSVGKPFMGTKCLCTDGVCQWTMNNPDFSCISNDEQVSIPVWTGGVFNFVKSTFSKYLVLKTRVSNLRNVDVWSYDQIDHVAHPEYLTQEFWDTTDSTLFVFCPFDVTLGGMNGGDGKIAFSDWYPSEQSADGKLWSFLSREGTKVNRQKCEAVDNVLTCTTKSNYFKGFIDWSPNSSERGPIEIHTGMVSGGTDYSCETGILPGHHPDAIAKLQQYFPIFENGDFSKMVNYLRNPPFDDTFTLN